MLRFVADARILMWFCVNILRCTGSKEHVRVEYLRMHLFTFSCSVQMARHLRHIQLMNGIALLRKSNTDISILKKQKMNIISMMFLLRCYFTDVNLYLIPHLLCRPKLDQKLNGSIQWVTLSFAETKVWDVSLRPKKLVWDLINAKTEVMLSFGLRLKSQTTLRAKTKV